MMAVPDDGKQNTFYFKQSKFGDSNKIPVAIVLGWVC